nr:integrase, catalytic region, zinc finger, CCHC-type, peptidase aspartic, catalytic [Tanacetum cinerariifolium]
MFSGKEKCTGFLAGKSIDGLLGLGYKFGGWTGKTLPVLKLGCVLYQDFVAFCLEDFLCFVLRPLRFVSRLSCVLSQDLMRFVSRLTAFCLHSVAFCLQASCVLSTFEDLFLSFGKRKLCSDTRPPMLDRTDFSSWQQRIRLYCQGKENELNSKFVNNMLPEWGRFVTAVKLNRGLRDSNYDQLYAYLKQHPVTDEARPSYDSNILSEVQDHDHYQDAVCAHHEEHAMHDSVQLDCVVDSHADYTSDSNMILYDQYVKDNEVLVVHTNVSSVPNDDFMMIYDDMCEPYVQSVSNPLQNTVVKNPLTAALATYKDQV